MTVGELLERVSATELIEWAAFAQLEPFGSMADDYRAGVGPALEANMHKDKQREPFRPLDFFPWHEKSETKIEPVTLTPEEEAKAIAKFLDPGKHG